MKMIFYFILILLIISDPFNIIASSFNSITSCRDNQIVDTIKKEIPVDRKGQVGGFYKWKNIIESKSGFQTLENGFDSLEIRIWYGHALSNKLQLIVFKNCNSRWNGKIYELNCIYDRNHDSILSISKKYRNVYPKSGWKDFILKMNNLKVQSLPNYNSIRDYNICSDGNGITVEVATRYIYRIYNYPCFESNENIWQAKNIAKAMELVEFEFSFKRLSVNN